MEITAKVIGKKIQERRERLGISQADAASGAKIPERTYQAYEAGQRIPADRFAILCQFLNISMDDLVFGVKAPPKVTAAQLSPEEFAGALAAQMEKKTNPNEQKLLGFFRSVANIKGAQAGILDTVEQTVTLLLGSDKVKNNPHLRRR